MFPSKLFLIFLFFTMILAGCMPVAVSRRVSAVQVKQVPPVSGSEATPGAEVKVAQMATQTPVKATRPVAQPTRVPDRPTQTGTSPVMPKTLAELGYQVETYRDAYAKLAFDYPADWKITFPDEAGKQSAVIYTISLRSGEAPAEPKQQEGVPEWMTAIDVTVFKNGPATLEQAIADRRASATTGESGQTIITQADEDWVLSGGLKAHRFLYDLGSPAPNTRDTLASELVTMIKGRMVLVNGYGDQSMFHIIAATIREIE